eukprot:2120905-Prymnesium_polylepis.2
MSLYGRAALQSSQHVAWLTEASGTLDQSRSGKAREQSHKVTILAYTLANTCIGHIPFFQTTEI